MLVEADFETEGLKELTQDLSGACREQVWILDRDA